MSGIFLHRMPLVEEKTGLKKSQIYELIARGEFPAPVKLGKRASAWRSDEVDRWINNRPRAKQC